MPMPTTEPVMTSARSRTARPARGLLRTASALAAIGAVLCLVLASCARVSAPEVATARESGSPPPAADTPHLVQQYIDCMRGQGVTMLDELTGEGRPQIDKDATPIDLVGPAIEYCAQFLPAETPPPAPAPEDVEKMRQYSVCLRENGLSSYPDPDPATGQPDISDELGARLKSDPHLDQAMRACSQLQPGHGAGTLNG
jgi:hypothetical protein